MTIEDFKEYVKGRKALDTEEILEYIYRCGYTSEQIARKTDTDINLVALKIAHMAETGYDLRPVEHRSDFLK